MAEAEVFTWVQRTFPSARKRKLAEMRIDAGLAKLMATTNGIRKEFDLDDLVDDIDRIRALGIVAMKEDAGGKDDAAE